MPRDPKHPLSRLRLAIELIQRNPFKSSHLQMAEQLLVDLEREALGKEGHEPREPIKPTLEEWVHAGYNPARYEQAMRELYGRPRLPG